ncbi:NAD(P)-dependent alcohol dehydrogenase [Bacillus sp. 03113]|uniref:zinc-dependent alcohol dehydrogenase family protein n=1 Tax=Bacillus sp. 03113 TaxID=2578211 RepID=UPI0011440EF3|nr:NAD(P)-dependent alcohol dehydrogenase [Bacillus sp. 03113]
MKSFEIQKTFSLDSLVTTERPKPVPGPNEVLIKMRAVSLNYRDLGVISGFYNPNLPLPLIPISDGVGEVIVIGDHVSRVKLGDRVSASFFQKWISGVPDNVGLQSTLGSPQDGLLTEYAIIHEDGLVHVPEHLTDEEAAALPCAGVTAWHAVVTKGKVQAGDTVVVQGTGGVSLFALQFAKMHGAKVIVTSSSDEKLEKAMKLGADFGINYKTTPDWEKEVLEFTQGIGADHVLDLGGADTLNKSMNAIRIGGQVTIIGILSGFHADGFNIITAIQRNVNIQGISVGSREMFESMNRAIQQNKMRPVIDRVFPFEQSVEALRYMEKGNHFGKICIKI